MRRGLEPPLDVGASQIRQGASLLEPATQRRLDVVVDVPVEEMAVNKTTKTRLVGERRGGVECGHLKCVANSRRWKVWPQRKVKTELARLCLLLTLSVCSWRRSFSGRSTITSARLVRPVNGAERKECVCVPTSM